MAATSALRHARKSPLRGSFSKSRTQRKEYAAKLVLQCLGMLPYKSTDLCAKAGHLCYFRNLDAERAFYSGGRWGSSSYGLASFSGNAPRSSAGACVGFRAAFVKLPTA